MIQGSGAVAEAGVGFDGSGDPALGLFDGGDKGDTTGEKRGDGGGIGAAGAVSVGRRDARGGQFEAAAVREQDVDGGAGEMAAFDEDVFRAGVGESAGGFAHGVDG